MLGTKSVDYAITFRVIIGPYFINERTGYFYTITGTHDYLPTNKKIPENASGSAQRTDSSVTTGWTQYITPRAEAISAMGSRLSVTILSRASGVD
jgi:hypothetical protein